MSSIEKQAQMLALEHLQDMNELVKARAIAELRKANADAEAAEILRDHAKRMARFPEMTMGKAGSFS